MSNRTHIKQLSAEALKNIETHQLKPNPDNYRVWFEYAAGNLETLVKSIDELIQSGRHINDEQSKDLFFQHLATEDQRRAESSISSVVNMLGKISSNIQSWGVGSEQYFNKLEYCRERLAQDPSPEEISIIIQDATAEIQKTIESGRLANQAISRLQDEINNLRVGIDQLSDQALTDALTGIANRRGFDLTLEKAIKDANGTQSSFVLILVDVDHFKSINDKFGHPTGDKVLCYVASLIRHTLRHNDFVARIGGEEFAIILPHTLLTHGETIAENLRQKLSARPLTRSSDKVSLGHITASFGVTRYQPNEDSRELIKRADENLYKAKQNGRNAVYSTFIKEL